MRYTPERKEAVLKKMMPPHALVTNCGAQVASRDFALSSELAEGDYQGEIEI